MRITMVQAIAALLAFPTCSAVQAQDSDAPIIVTATRTGDEALVPEVAIDAATIDLYRSDSLLDVLGTVAGVRAVSTGGFGGGSFVSIRGGEPNFTLVLLEGLKLNNPVNSRGGAFDFTQIDPALVETVNVARGGVSASFGSDALSGAIDVRIRTPQGEGLAAFARSALSSDGDWLVSGGGETGWGNGGALLAASHYDSADLGPGSDLRRTQLIGKIRQDIGIYTLSLFGLHGDADRTTFPEDSGGVRLAVNRERETSELGLTALSFNLRSSGTDGFRTALTVAWSRQDERTRTPLITPGVFDGVPAIDADTRFERFEAIPSLTFARTGMVATIGGAVAYESGRSTGTIDIGFPLPADFALRRTTVSGFAETTITPIPRLDINLATRIDGGGGVGDRWTERVALRWQPVPETLYVHAQIADGFRLPSFYALGQPLIGNPDLLPERSRNAEIGIEWRGGAGRLGITGFANRFRNLVDFDAATFRLVNRNSVRAHGVEIEAALAPTPRLTLTGALTWLDLDSAVPLRGRPEWQGSLRAVWRAAPTLDLFATARANGEFNDSSIPTGPIVANGYAVADIGAVWRALPQLRVGLVLRNLTDERHEDAVGVPAPGRALQLTVSIVTR
jgi:vitamin B12 transporter